MKKIVYLLTIGFCLLAIQANAQILNIEKFRLEKDTANAWFGNAGLSISAKKQYSEVKKFSGSLNAVFLSKNNGYMLLNKYSLLQVNDNDVISEGYSHLRLNFWRRKKVSLEQFNQYQYDIGRKLNSRVLFGVTARFRLLHKEKISLSANTGFMYEDENWKTSDSTYFDNNSIKSTTNITLKTKLHKKIAFYFISYYQAKPESFFKPRLTVDSSLQFIFTKNFSFTTSFVSTYDADYIVPIAEFIYTLNSGINITF
ncbi:MAG: DUF481 domain-containing protein [Cytophagales bacterium]|nr:DUF481 domain-containing protein [Cytophagales bacterium]